MTAAAHGVWLARWLDGANGKQTCKTLGALTQLPAHLRFAAGVCAVNRDAHVHTAVLALVDVFALIQVQLRISGMSWPC